MNDMIPFRTEEEQVVNPFSNVMGFFDLITA